MGEYWSRGTKLQLCKMNKSRDVMYSMTTMTNNTILNVQILLRLQLSGALSTKTRVVIILGDNTLISSQLCKEIH